MQHDEGIRRVLSFAWVYEKLQDLVGAARMRRWLAQAWWRAKPGDRIIDIGCGPGGVLDAMPRGVHYVGIDLSEAYVRSAQRRHGERGQFIVGNAAHLSGTSDPRLRDADLILCTGLLHHLEDAEALAVLAFARAALAPRGRLVCLEPTFLVHQSRFSRWLMRQDRGGNVRDERAWRDLARQVFPGCDTVVATHLYRIPYIHVVIEGRLETRRGQGTDAGTLSQGTHQT